jgi:ABC-type bacteriocin/lantibiotic exporter with double-glycine peptidase domain
MRNIWLGLATIFLLASLGVSRGQETHPNEVTFSCGLNATYILLNRTGHHASYAGLMQEFKKQNPPDSLLAIRNVLKNHGCDTVGIKADPQFFLDNKGPAIVHLQLSGFAPTA